MRTLNLEPHAICPAWNYNPAPASIGHGPTHVKTGSCSLTPTNCVMAAIERLSKSRLHIVFGSGYTSSDARAYVLQVQASEASKAALIVVDYVQLLRDLEGDGRVRERNVSAAARGLKDISGELGVPVLA
jgi:replicative DNA helicase